ncbi:hypothetical protein U9M48_031142 [Paspalum notatum var. saurae]|uniref:Uncharacterized protein n=1 Tax=Paspalum notatum var. saurae TaxID=547442 RepID=A0AAQ3X4F7_PASNO
MACDRPQNHCLSIARKMAHDGDDDRLPVCHVVACAELQITSVCDQSAAPMGRTLWHSSGATKWHRRSPTMAKVNAPRPSVSSVVTASGGGLITTIADQWARFAVASESSAVNPTVIDDDNNDHVSDSCCSALSAVASVSRCIPYYVSSGSMGMVCFRLIRAAAVATTNSGDDMDGAALEAETSSVLLPSTDE